MNVVIDREVLGRIEAVRAHALQYPRRPGGAYGSEHEVRIQPGISAVYTIDLIGCSSGCGRVATVAHLSVVLDDGSAPDRQLMALLVELFGFGAEPLVGVPTGSPASVVHAVEVLRELPAGAEA